MAQGPTAPSVGLVMDSRRMRVAVGVDPYVLRTAVHAVLALDSRFDAILLPDTDDLMSEAEAADAVLLLVSRPVEGSKVRVARLSEGLQVLEVAEAGDRLRTIPFEGLPSLAELLTGLGSDRKEEDQPTTLRL